VPAARRATASSAIVSRRMPYVVHRPVAGGGRCPGGESIPSVRLTTHRSRARRALLEHDGTQPAESTAAAAPQIAGGGVVSGSSGGLGSGDGVGSGPGMGGLGVGGRRASSVIPR
jgi:hypothetical protein